MEIQNQEIDIEDWKKERLDKSFLNFYSSTKGQAPYLFTAELHKSQNISNEKNNERQIKLLEFYSVAGSLGRNAFAVVVQLALLRYFFMNGVPIVAKSRIKEP